MTYYIVNTQYILHPNQTKELIDKTSGIVNDIDGTALNQAENRFYARLIGEIDADIDFGNTNVGNGPEVLNVEEWFTDSACTMCVLKISITHSQLIRNFQTQISGLKPIDKELKYATLLHEADVPNLYTDAHFTRERLYRNRDGVYLFERNFATGEENIEWHSEIQPIRDREAVAWGEKHMPKEAFVRLFDKIEEDTTREPFVIAIRKDVKQELIRYAQTTGKKESAVIEDALTQFFKKDTRQ